MAFDPTDEQRAVLAHNPERHGRLLAGPGTGKSATLVALVERLRGLANPPSLRLVTFTRAATGELAKKVSENPATAAERPSTIHSFAIAVLVRNPGTGNLPEPLRIADDWEYREIVRPTLARRAGIGVRRLDQLVREMAANWESLRDDEDPRVSAEERARFQGAWGEHRRTLGYTLLQELPFALRRALTDHDDLVGVDYDLLIVDEYQDLNACDLEVLRLLAQSGCMILGAGDDDQSIYSFRKAAPEGIRRFQHDYPESDDYSLSVAQRCGAEIIDWARWVIEGDPDRPRRARLIPAEGAPRGEVALLSFQDQAAEARGIARLVERLVNQEHLPPDQVLVLLRGDHNGGFSGPIKDELTRLGIAYSDPDAVERMLDENSNRRMMVLLRLAVDRADSLAWAALMQLEQGIGQAAFDFIYERAIEDRATFGATMLDAIQHGFDGAPAGSGARLERLARNALGTIEGFDVDDPPGTGWGEWIAGLSGSGTFPRLSEDFVELLKALDDLTEPDAGLGRFLGQISPLGKDRERNQSPGIRIMTMAGAKGLTVRATIIAALEEGIIPRPDAELSEERRLLYVAMTRSREYLFGTWARRRTGPTARAGAPRVGAQRTYTDFLTGGPVDSERGNEFLRERWPDQA